MNNINYQKQLLSIIDNLGNKKPKLLLHTCCCPCFLVPFEILKDHFDITIYYFNPNIYPYEEYERRKDELLTFLKQHHLDEVKVVIPKYDSEEIYQIISPRKDDKEGHERCRLCFRYRLTHAFQYAKENNFDYVSTVMSISRYKSAKDLNEIGFDLESKKEWIPVKWLPADFKKNNGYEKELVLCKNYGLYFQKYCGCKYSYEAFLAKQNKN
ncbi:MAG: epoxyqueuosine reductase QueH [Bacilli bacterium]